MTYLNRPTQQLVRLIAILILMAVAGCSNDSTKTFEPVDPPTVLGEWEGTIQFIDRPTDSTSIVTGPVETYFEINDSTFTYILYNEQGFVDARYGGTGGYIATDTTIQFELIAADPSANTKLIPYSNRPHSLSMTHQTLTITRIELYGPTASTEQRIELERTH